MDSTLSVVGGGGGGGQEQEFMSVISRFQSKDFAETTNSEVVLLKCLFEINNDRKQLIERYHNNTVENESIDVSCAVNVPCLESSSSSSLKRKISERQEFAAFSNNLRRFSSVDATNEWPWDLMQKTKETKRLQIDSEPEQKQDFSGYTSEIQMDDDIPEFLYPPTTPDFSSESYSLVQSDDIVCKNEPESQWSNHYGTMVSPTVSPPTETKRLIVEAPVGRVHFPNSIRGETRLNITFFSIGNCGEIPQRFGKNNCGIPDGLSGTHEMYDQRWKFEVKHQRQGSLVLITWKVINLTSKTVLTVTETPQDAMVRENCGRTICNMVLRTALENRAKELQMSLAAADPQTRSSRMSSTENLVKVLRPKRCTVGLLFFGLLHEKVQRNFANQVAKLGLQ